MSENIEIWKPVVGYEDCYMVSSFGRVKSVKRKIKHPLNGEINIKERILKQHVLSSGYLAPSPLSKNGKTKTIYTHKLVAEAFIPNPENKPCIDHINTIKTDNTVWLNEDGSINYEKTNLRWVTYKENSNNPLTIKKLSKINKIA